MEIREAEKRLWNAARGCMQYTPEGADGKSLADMATQTNYNDQSLSLITLCTHRIALKEGHFFSSGI